MAAALLTLSVAALGQPRPEVPATSPPLERILPLEAVVNGEKTGTWPFVERLGELYAPRDALDEWRVRIGPDVQPIELRGVQYWPLVSVPGFRARINFSSQSVEIDFAAESFTGTKVTAQPAQRLRASPVLSSVFANYEFSYATSRTQGTTSSTDVGLLAELGASTQWGVLTSSHVGRNLSHSGSNPAGWTRLETTFTHDLPDRNLTLRLGDSTTRIGLWGRSVYYAGVQIGSNFALTPGYLTQPVPIVSGISSAPSSVELYVNDVLRQVSQVPAGPFAISNTNALTGSGEARVVVRDILGRETVITQPFFTSVQLLAPGLNDWTAETGAQRRDLGLANARYGPPFAAGTWRRGITERATLEGRAELTGALRAVGIGVIAGLPANFLGRVAGVVSRDDSAGTGSQWVAGVERQWLATSVNLQGQGASRDFRSVGLSDPVQRVKLQWVANGSYQLSARNSVSAAFASIRRFDTPAMKTVSANYTWRFGRNSSVTASVGRAFGPGAGTSVGVMLQIPLDRNRQVTATAQRHGGTRDVYATASQTDSLEGEFGWRVLGGELADRSHAEGGLYYTGRHGRVYSELSVSPGTTAVRTGAIGGLVLADGHFFATRRMDQSFAVVELKDLAGVGVGIGSGTAARTDAGGTALVPNLGAYQPNQIRLEPMDLPISADVESIERIVVPPWRSGVKVDFPVRAGRAALLKINFDDGEVAPPGAVVRIDGDAQEFFVARRGEAYVTGLKPVNRLLLTWGKGQCRMDLVLPPAEKDEIKRVGPLTCSGVKR